MSSPDAGFPDPIQQLNQDANAVAALVREKPALLDTLFRVRKTYAQELVPLTDEERDLLFRFRLIQPDGGQTTFYPRYRLGRELTKSGGHGVLVTRDFPRREGGTETYRAADRVFPWPDESAQVFEYVVRQYKEKPPRSVLNLCCGSGALLLGLARRWGGKGRFVGVEILEHATRRCDYNLRLNQQDSPPLTGSIEFRCGDLYKALPEGDKFDLIVSVPAYAPYPPESDPDNNAGRHSGGITGFDVVRPMLEQCRDWLNPNGRLICQTYSLGNRREPTLAQVVAGDALDLDDADKVTKVVLPMNDEWKVWRFQDDKCFDAPMPLEYMIVRCADPTYHLHDQFRAKPVEKMTEHVNWIKGLQEWPEEKGGPFTHLHYVMIDYKHTRPKAR